MKQRRDSARRFWRLTVLVAAGLASASGFGAPTYGAILSDPARWPKEVEIKAAAKGRVLEGDRLAGLALIGGGRTLPVLRLRADGVVVKSGSTTVLLPVAETNLLALVGAGALPESAPPPAPAPAAPAAPAPVIAAPANETGPKSPIQQLLLGRLVQLDHGVLKPYDMRKLNGVKFYGIMFSAGWCGPCRAFAPHLLESYRSIRSIYPEFELVLVSNDRSPDAMLAYMRDEQMPWPALKYSEIRRTEAITRLAGPGIPCLVLIDANGRVLADSFKGDDYLGPDSVIDATWRVLKRSRRGG